MKSYFAEINEAHEVLRVIVGVKEKGAAYYANLLGGEWVESDELPGVDYTYDQTRAAFLAPQPHSSWVLDEATLQWKAPVDQPVDVPPEYLRWQEETTTWKDTRMLLPQRDFLRRLKHAEVKDIMDSEDAVVIYFRTMAMVDNKPIDTESLDTIQALTHMESTGKLGGGAILAVGRKDEILAISA